MRLREENSMKYIIFFLTTLRVSVSIALMGGNMGNKQELFDKAIKNNKPETVGALLKDPRVDPTTLYNFAIRHASECGYTEIVKLLLKDSRVDPTTCDNYAVCWASLKGHTEIVKILLQDSRVDPTADDNYAIRWASIGGHPEVVKLLLKDSRVDPTARNNYAIRWASLKGYTEIVKILLQDSRVDPTADDNYAIRMASYHGHHEIIKLLKSHINKNQKAKDKRQKVYEAIDSERDYQDKVWDNTQNNNPASFILYMEEYLNRARTLASTREEAPGTEGCEEIMDMVRKVVALGVACGEVNGMPKRK